MFPNPCLRPILEDYTERRAFKKFSISFQPRCFSDVLEIADVELRDNVQF